MSDKMEVAGEGDGRKDSTEDMELETESGIGNKSANKGLDIPDSRNANPEKYTSNVLLKLDIVSSKTSVTQVENTGLENGSKTGIDCKLSPPVLVNNTRPFQNNDSPNCDDSAFQKPTVCRTHSLGASDPSQFTIRRRPGRLAFANPIQSPSAFERKLQSPVRVNVLHEMEDSALKRCNSAPMLNEINDNDGRMTWNHGSITPGSVRARRFSATVLSSPSAGSARSTSRLHQLKKEESIEGIQYKETAHEREVQTSIQMYHTCEELSLSDVLNGSSSASSNEPTSSRTFGPSEPSPRSPLPSTAPVNIPVSSKLNSTRAIDFSITNQPLHNHHGSGGSIPSPLTISTSPLCQSPLPPSPTRNLCLSTTGKQCFSPSMQVTLPPTYLRPDSISPSPSPTRRHFVTRRRSQSPCVLKPSPLGPIKRKYDSDSEGGCSPKRMFVLGPNVHVPGGQTHGDSFTCNIVTPHFSRNIHRSHSLSSSSIDSDMNVSPSPPQNGVTAGFMPSAHPLGSTNHHARELSTGSSFQSPLHATQFTATGGAQEQTRSSSPASSTCSSSSLEGLKDLPPMPQNHLASYQSSNLTPTLIKPPIKDHQLTRTYENERKT